MNRRKGEAQLKWICFLFNFFFSNIWLLCYFLFRKLPSMKNDPFSRNGNQQLSPKRMKNDQVPSNRVEQRTEKLIELEIFSSDDELWVLWIDMGNATALTFGQQHETWQHKISQMFFFFKYVYDHVLYMTHSFLIPWRCCWKFTVDVNEFRYGFNDLWYAMMNWRWYCKMEEWSPVLDFSDSIWLCFLFLKKNIFF